jgi:hypothetical protein
METVNPKHGTWLQNYLHLNLLSSYMNQVTCSLIRKFYNVGLDKEQEHRMDSLRNK